MIAVYKDRMEVGFGVKKERGGLFALNGDDQLFAASCSCDSELPTDVSGAAWGASVAPHSSIPPLIT